MVNSILIFYLTYYRRPIRKIKMCHVNYYIVVTWRPVLNTFFVKLWHFYIFYREDFFFQPKGRTCTIYRVLATFPELSIDIKEPNQLFKKKVRKVSSTFFFQSLSTGTWWDFFQIIFYSSQLHFVPIKGLIHAPEFYLATFSPVHASIAPNYKKIFPTERKKQNR